MTDKEVYRECIPPGIHLSSGLQSFAKEMLVDFFEQRAKSI